MFQPSPIQTYLTRLARKHGLEPVQPGKKTYLWLESRNKKQLHIWTTERSVMISYQTEHAGLTIKRSTTLCFATRVSYIVPQLRWIPLLRSTLIGRWVCISIAGSGFPEDLATGHQLEASDFDPEYYRVAKTPLSFLRRDSLCDLWLSRLQAEGWHKTAVRRGSGVEDVAAR